jgi:aminoglycoside phosphotransferase (APT) family kinase protein
LRWVERSVSQGARVERLRAIPGGLSASVHAIDVVDRRGRRHRLVLKRFIWDDPEEPDMALREGRILELVSSLPLPTPQLVALDRHGESSGFPSLLMTRLPGRPVLRPHDPARWVRQLAELLPPIHALDTSGTTLDVYRPYSLEAPAQPPPWSRRSAVWSRAIDVFRSQPPELPRHFIHRDYHPGNVLWQRSRPSGVVDWLHGCLGVASADLGHCRGNLWDLAGPAAADRLLLEYGVLTGSRLGYNPYWDIAAALGGLPDLLPGRVPPDAPDARTARSRARLEDFVVAAVARL